jgi:hypothetical protein
LSIISIDAFANSTKQFLGHHTINCFVIGRILHILLQPLLGSHMVWLRDVASWIWALDFG